MKKCLWLAMILVVICLAFAGCTEQERARQFGGTTTEVLPCNRKLVLVTWKETDLWLLTRLMREGETAEAYSLKESSSWGLMQGEVIIEECIKMPTP